jgi:dolichyl-phosphate beta-glucosyltransferase
MEPQQNEGGGGDGSGLSIVVPAYDEARRLPGTLPRMIEHVTGLADLAEIIVVDDGRPDGTGDVAAAAPPGGPVVVLRSSPNRSNGAAVRRGMLAARFGQVLFTDVDLSTPIEETTKLRAALARGAAVAIGSRRLAESDVQMRQPWRRELAGRTSGVTTTGTTSGSCGTRAACCSTAASVSTAGWGATP